MRALEREHGLHARRRTAEPSYSQLPAASAASPRSANASATSRRALQRDARKCTQGRGLCRWERRTGREHTVRLAFGAVEITGFGEQVGQASACAHRKLRIRRARPRGVVCWSIARRS
jgi:hypothetical protein